MSSCRRNQTLGDTVVVESSVATTAVAAAKNESRVVVTVGGTVVVPVQSVVTIFPSRFIGGTAILLASRGEGRFGTE